MARDYPAELREIEKQRIAINEATRTEGQTERDRLEAAIRENPEHEAIYREEIAGSKAREEDFVNANDKLAANKVSQVEADQRAEQESAKEVALVPPPPPPDAAPAVTSQTYEASAQWNQPGPYQVDVQLPPAVGDRGPEPVEQVATEAVTYAQDQRGELFSQAAGATQYVAESGDFVTGVALGAAVAVGAAVQGAKNVLEERENRIDAAVNAPPSPELAAENQLRGEIEAADRAKPAAQSAASELEIKAPPPPPPPQPTVEEQNKIMEEYRTAPPTASV